MEATPILVFWGMRNLRLYREGTWASLSIQDLFFWGNKACAILFLLWTCSTLVRLPSRGKWNIFCILVWVTCVFFYQRCFSTHRRDLAQELKEMQSLSGGGCGAWRPPYLWDAGGWQSWSCRFSLRSGERLPAQHSLFPSLAICADLIWGPLCSLSHLPSQPAQSDHRRWVSASMRLPQLRSQQGCRIKTDCLPLIGPLSWWTWSWNNQK